MQVEVLDLAVEFPGAAPGIRERHESFVGGVVVHHPAVAWLGFPEAQVEAFADADRSVLGRLRADRRDDLGAGFAFGRLEAHGVVELAHRARVLAVGQAAVEALEVLEEGDALAHLFVGDTDLGNGHEGSLGKWKG